MKFRATNPATGEAIDPEFTSATAEDIDRAVSLAADAFPIYSHTGGKEKGAFLRAIAANLEANAEAIIERANLETALPAGRLKAEMARTCGQLRLFAALVEEGSWCDARIDRGDPERKPNPKPDLRSMLRPLGPVAVFGASNFPLAFSVPGGDTASALAGGCPVVVKAHPAHPGTSQLAGDAIRQALRDSDLPEGVFSLIFDAGYEAGIRLVQHPAIRAVAFTGSHRGGRALMEIASRRSEPIPVYAEMGSINPVFLLPGALREQRDRIAAGLHTSVTTGVGQFCTNPGVIVTQHNEAFLSDLQERLSATPAGTMLTSGICESYHASLDRLAQRTEWYAPPARLSEARQRHAPLLAPAALFTTNAATFLSDESLRDEVFGPSTLVVECDSSAQFLDVARALEGQLTVTVHGDPDDLLAHRELIEILETKAGRVVFNGFPTGVEVNHAIVHGGPYPATSDGRSTSVGTRAIERFVRPVCYQDYLDALLPPELREDNPLAIRRLVDGRFDSD